MPQVCGSAARRLAAACHKLPTACPAAPLRPRPCRRSRGWRTWLRRLTPFAHRQAPAPRSRCLRGRLCWGPAPRQKRYACPAGSVRDGAPHAPQSWAPPRAQQMPARTRWTRFAEGRLGRFAPMSGYAAERSASGNEGTAAKARSEPRYHVKASPPSSRSLRRHRAHPCPLTSAPRAPP